MAEHRIHESPPRSPRVQEGIPPTPPRRAALRDAARRYAQEHRLVPPLSLDDLHRHTRQLAALSGEGDDVLAYAAVLLNNEAWRPTLAAVPHARRLVLLPKCLRHPAECPATIDEFGLVCRACGRCVIGAIKQRAEALGCIVLVAEGTAVVLSLVQTGRVDAVIGVGCMDSLTRIFPVMEAAAVPAVAIPLLRDGCSDTDVDADWALEALEHSAPGRQTQAPSALPLWVRLRATVDELFEPQRLRERLGAGKTDPARLGATERIAVDWLARSGKRWRPLLTIGVYQALAGEDAETPRRPDAEADGSEKRHAADLIPPAEVLDAAVAIECFHKASLIHDDIEDGDSHRYGRPTLHAEWGVPTALNVGDWLLGEGYQLLSACPAPPERRSAMLRVAAEGHRTLCDGQGDELLWARDRRALSVEQVLDIFRRKTAPAFEVALRIGAILAGQDDELGQELGRFSAALGTAYQIHDDLDDWSGGDGSDLDSARPSILAAIAFERAEPAARRNLEAFWRGEGDARALREALRALGVESAAFDMLEAHKQQAVAVLANIQSAPLKSLLRRVVGGIGGPSGAGVHGAGAAP